MNKHQFTIIRSLKLIYIVVVTALFALFLIRCRELGAEASVTPLSLLATCVGYAVVLAFIGKQYNAYGVGLVRISELVCSIFLTNVISNLLFYMLACLTARQFVYPLDMLLLLATQCLCGLAWGVVANTAYFKLCQRKKAAAIYKDRFALQRITALRFFSLKYDLISKVESPTTLEQAIEAMQGCEVVFVVGMNAALRAEITNYCMVRNIAAYVEPGIEDIMMSGCMRIETAGGSMVRIARREAPFEYLFLKRAGDVLLSAAGLVVTAPLFLLVSLAIKLCDRGPVFYKQTRLTKNRKEFKIIKFRSMRTDAEKNGIARMASDNDDRITPVGRVLRACRLDELPQLINILKGEMSIVGPRPERPELTAEYEQAVPAFALRLQVNAGLTGYAQVYGKYNTDPYDKLQMDLIYINKMSVLEDMMLLLATVKVVFMKESTEGVAIGQMTALKESVSEAAHSERSA